MGEAFNREWLAVGALAAIGVDVPATQGNDTIAGDVIGDAVELSEGAGNANDSGAGRNGETVRAFIDRIAGLGGGDELVGDVLAGNAGHVQTSIGAGLGYGDGYPRGRGGNEARAFVFNDALAGGAGGDTIVGDVLLRGNGLVASSVRAGDGGGARGRPGESGARNSAIAANDSLFGGDAEDVLVGDVLREDGESGTNLRASAGCAARYLHYGGFFDGSDGGDDNAARAFNDRVAGGAADDVLVGDLLTRAVAGNSSLSGEAGQGSLTGLSGGTGNRVITFGDRLQGGDGGDEIAGDVRLQLSFRRIDLNALAGNGGRSTWYHGPDSGGRGGDGNLVRAFADTAVGGQGADNITGDLSLRFTGGTAMLVAAAGNGIDSSGSGRGGGGGDHNTVAAFADKLRGGGDDDVIVGDVAATSVLGAIELRAVAGHGGAESGSEYYAYAGGPGGDANRVSAFQDHILGGSGRDLLVGDLHLSDVAATTRITVIAGSGGADASSWGDTSELGGAGGDGNRVAAFNDTLTGNGKLVGDVWASNETGPVEVRISAGADGQANAGTGGSGNLVQAFNDILTGGSENDVLIGDLDLDWSRPPPTVAIVMEGNAGNFVRAFRDSLFGGAGADHLIGDISYGYTLDLTIRGDFERRERLFADTLRGGGDNDTINGGLGADSLSGGTGADMFEWGSQDLYDLVAGSPESAPPIDVITDFNLLDRLSLSDLVLSPDDIDDGLHLRRVGDDTVLAIDRNGSVGGADFQDFLILRDFTTDLTLQELHDQGTIVF